MPTGHTVDSLVICALWASITQLLNKSMAQQSSKFLNTPSFIFKLTTIFYTNLTWFEGRQSLPEVLGVEKTNSPGEHTLNKPGYRPICFAVPHTRQANNAIY